MVVISPITLGTNTKIRNTIKCSDIVDLYRTELDMDVANTFNGLDSISIYECRDSGYRFYYPLNLGGDEHFYDDLKQKIPLKYKSPYYSEFKWEYDITCAYLKTEESLYEIGAGTGFFLEKLKKQGYKKLYGSELNSESIKAASSKGIHLELKSIEDQAKESTNKFDVVCCFQVLEHVENVNSFINCCLKILKSGGKLIIAVPFNNPYLFKNDILNTLNLPPHHMGLWNKKAFENLPDFFPMSLSEIVIEKLPSAGYDFERYFQINNQLFSLPLNLFKISDRLYKWWLRRHHLKYHGKNMIAVFYKN